MIVRPIIVLHHEETNHRELWFEENDHHLRVVTVCPANYPPYEMSLLSVTEAVRQLRLMTRDVEGWQIEHWTEGNSLARMIMKL